MQSNCPHLSDNYVKIQSLNFNHLHNIPGSNPSTPTQSINPFKQQQQCNINKNNNKIITLEILIITIGIVDVPLIRYEIRFKSKLNPFVRQVDKLKTFELNMNSIKNKKQIEENKQTNGPVYLNVLGAFIDFRCWNCSKISCRDMQRLKCLKD